MTPESLPAAQLRSFEDLVATCAAAAGVAAPRVTTRFQQDCPNAKVRWAATPWARLDATPALVRAPRRVQLWWVAHELGHLVHAHRHPVRDALTAPAVQIAGMSTFILASAAAFVACALTQTLAAGLALLTLLVLAGAGMLTASGTHSRRREYDADRDGVRILEILGADGTSLAVDALAALPTFTQPEPRGFTRLTASHPHPTWRVSALQRL